MSVHLPGVPDPKPGEHLNVAEMLGGPRGLVDAGLPGVVFAVAYGVNGQHLRQALWFAIGTAAVLFVVSLLEKRPVQQAITGLIGVGVMAFVAAKTGRPENFYLPSILKNAGYAAAYVISILVRWPLLGLFLGPLLGEGLSWRKDPARRRAYALASWLWAAMFAIRVAVQLPLYFAGQVTWLGVVGIPLGLPLFLLTGWLSYLILRRVPVARPQQADEAPSAESPLA